MRFSWKASIPRKTRDERGKLVRSVKKKLRYPYLQAVLNRDVPEYRYLARKISEHDFNEWEFTQSYSSNQDFKEALSYGLEKNYNALEEFMRKRGRMIKYPFLKRVLEGTGKFKGLTKRLQGVEPRKFNKYLEGRYNPHCKGTIEHVSHIIENFMKRA